MRKTLCVALVNGKYDFTDNVEIWINRPQKIVFVQGANFDEEFEGALLEYTWFTYNDDICPAIAVVVKEGETQEESIKRLMQLWNQKLEKQMLEIENSKKEWSLFFDTCEKDGYPVEDLSIYDK